MSWSESSQPQLQLACFTLKMVSKLLLRWKLHFSNNFSVSCSSLYCLPFPTLGPVRDQLFGSLFRSLLLLNDNFLVYGILDHIMRTSGDRLCSGRSLDCPWARWSLSPVKSASSPSFGGP